MYRLLLLDDQTQIQKRDCISGAEIEDNIFAVDDCHCSIKPKIIIDATPPTCDTPCGTINCGEEVTCDLGNGQDYTATCSWKGWETIAPNIFQPKLGS